MTNEEKLKRAEKRLRAAIESGLEEGWTLIKGRMRGIVYDDNYAPVVDDACGCALGMVVRDEPLEVAALDETPLYTVARSRLGLEDVETSQIWMGFDGTRSSEEYAQQGEPYRALGAKMREDYYETKEVA